ncbi:MAG TPA: response regulator [Gemmatimonadaceae bacterium]|nr:response regulator [Gemmatimonadaceae bacterium]
MIETNTPPRLVLVASEGEWVGRSLENVLELNGYTVLRVETGRRALELARRTNPDAILLDDSLADIEAIDVCRALRDDPLFNRATPIFITASAQHAGRVRAAAYAAGAWEYCNHPLDLETLLAKLGTFIRAASDVDVQRSRAFIDRMTGLYSQYALEQWAEHIGARALRKREPIACVVLTADFSMPEGSSLTPEQASEALAEVTDICRATSRKSDVVGYLGDSRIAILAPDTDAAGVQRLINRLQQAHGQSSGKTRAGRRTSSLRAGYCAVSNLAAANIAPSELVKRAETALEHAPRGRFETATSFDEVLLS